MKTYNYFLLEDANGYGQPTVSQEPKGQIKMAINIMSQSIQDSILYSGAQYIGLTKSTLTDKYIIDYDNQKLKVLYINSLGRLKQVYLAKV